SLDFRNNTDQVRLIHIRVEIPEGVFGFEVVYTVSPHATVNHKWLGVVGCVNNPTLVKVWAEGMEDKAHTVKYRIYEGFIIVDHGAWAIIRDEAIRKTINLNMSPAPAYTIPKKGISVYPHGTTVWITLGNVPFGLNSYYATSQDPYWYGKTGYDWYSPVWSKDQGFTVWMDRNKGLWIWLLPGGNPAWMPWEDINLDGKVDLRDLFPIYKAYGKTSEDPDWDWSIDVYPDGKVDLRDLFPVFMAYGTSDEALKRDYPAGLTVPTQVNIASGINAALAGSVAACFTAVLAEQVKRAIRRKP
ncbi:MAG: hypothetical protein QXD09_05355, partial [Candidatus Caldarchaeum sp.]